MPRVHESVDINAPVEKVFAYVEDPRNAPEWIFSMVDIYDLSAKGYKWTWKMAGVKLKGQSDFVEDIHNRKIVLKGKGDIESDWVLSFEPHGNMTHFDLDIDYKIPSRLFEKASQEFVMNLNDREAHENLLSIKKKMEM